MKLFAIHILLILTGLAMNAQAQITNINIEHQNPDSLKKQAERIRAHVFGTTDTAKLSKVLMIQKEYKEDMEKVQADISLTKEDKFLKMQRIVAEKNIKLSKILTRAELKMFLPATERVAPLKSELPLKEKSNPLSQ